MDHPKNPNEAPSKPWLLPLRTMIVVVALEAASQIVPETSKLKIAFDGTMNP